MFRNRTILFALLIPLMLNLLAAFVAEPLREQDRQTCIELKGELCPTDGMALVKEHPSDEAHVFFYSVSRKRLIPECDSSGSGTRLFFMPSFAGSPLADGWRMPLRI
ncbi:hypothetical protein [Pontiella agarivorans]|uniref:Uncharacterized protein n=1 Tax=Pontiella agarivorans TaxID=3038953 RepID=A0ABU5MUW9_9BACT|nr:hypothetical protein [Pontiella agarivorans]MDZ8118011.1 hypothetical protein [Pontiella agarivorans]